MPHCARCSTTANLETHHVVSRCNRGSDGAAQVLCHDSHVRLHAEAGHDAAWGRAGAQAAMALHGAEGRAFLQEIGARGGRTVLERYGPEYLRKLGRCGGQTTAENDGHVRRIAARGRQAVVQRHAPQHMCELGRRGAVVRWEKDSG